MPTETPAKIRGYNGWQQREGEMVVVFTTKSGAEHAYKGDQIDKLATRLAEASPAAKEIADRIYTDAPQF